MNLVGRLTRHLKFTSQTPGGSILTARSVTLSVFLFAAVLLRGLGELFSIRVVSEDWGVLFYFGVGHVLDALRVSLQGILLYQGLVINTRTTAEKIDVAHIFVFSTLHLVRSVVYCIAGLQGEHMNLTTIAIMIGTLVGGFLQLCLMKKTVWAYVRLVDLIIAVLLIPISLFIKFPPYDKDFITADMEEVIAPPPPPSYIATENSNFVKPPEIRQPTNSYIATDNSDTLRQRGTNQPANMYSASITVESEEAMLDEAIQHKDEAAALDIQDDWYHFHKFPKHYPEDDNEAEYDLVDTPVNTWYHNSVKESGEARLEQLVM